MKSVRFQKSKPIRHPLYGDQITYNVKYGTKKIGEIHQFTGPISRDAGFEWVVYNGYGAPVYHALFLEESQLFCSRFPNKVEI